MHGLRRIRLRTKCCVSCFEHEFIRDFIRAQSVETEDCQYCGASRRRVIFISALADYFHNLVSMYEESDDGDTLISLVQDGWGIFSEALHESGKSRELLEDILNSDWDDDSGELPVNAHNTYRSREVLHEVESWETFCEAVKENPEEEPDFSEYFDEELAGAERAIPNGTILYRARPGWMTEERGRRLPFRDAEIGAPPNDKAKVGRANREGRVVLYCAESEQTAVAEVRPARGFWVSTCRLRARRDLRILDLINGIPALHPFTDETLAWSVEFSDLLRSFAEALSTPLARSDDVADYLPSQKLCEHVEQLHCDGVRYPSAMEDGGINLVLFNPSVAEILESSLVEVTSVTVGFHRR
jgi:hypothetical protein